jgi:hypothetical protein
MCAPAEAAGHTLRLHVSTMLLMQVLLGVLLLLLLLAQS